MWRADWELPSEQWLAEVSESVSLIEALPCVVGHVGFNIGDAANDNKVWVAVNCCWEPSRRSFKQVREQCTEDGNKPTHLEALRALYEKLQFHAAPGHKHHQRAVEQRYQLAKDNKEGTNYAPHASSSNLPPPKTFNFIITDGHASFSKS